ncbi:TlpA family protein disulfide reductase, partial [Arachidicoccus sp.]|uniref:TlpA family protein disulfide reductase n=1 Tax=Arachidicoccus sp. TaxID=1872624 RepID=UPI003D1D2008
MDKLKHIRRCGLSAFIITGIFCGCQNNTAHTKHERIDSSTAKSKSNYIRTYSLNVDSLTKDFSTFWDYWNSYLNFSKPFISYDENENKITKDEFFQKLLSARFLPVLIKEDDTSQYIQLKRIKLIANGSINRIIKQEADLHYRFYKMEGKQLPGFNFKDLDGNVYNNQNCVGKTLVINTWFVTCTACIHEMPDLNQLVDQYKDRNDVLFLGFCLDSPDKVK